MKQKAMIWRKTVYDAGFVCKCGADLTADHATKIGTFEGGTYLFCAKCAHVVAKITDIDVPEKLAPGTYGDYLEFERKMKN